MPTKQERALLECVSIDIDIRSEKIKEWVAIYFQPADIFETSELEDWALSNGFIKENA